MNNSQIIRLPFLSTIGRSFLYTFANLGTVFKISLSWVVFLIIALCGGYYYCISGGQGYPGVNADRLSNFLVVFSTLLTVVMLTIQVAFNRRTILHQNFKPFYISFGPREWKYLFYTFLIVAIIVVPVIIISALVSFFKVNEAYSSYIVLAAFLISAIVFSRLVLALPAIAVDNHDIRLRKSWKMTKGNANRIFWGLIILAIPGYVCFVLLGSLSMYLGPVADTLIMKAVFLVLIFAVSFIDVCLKASYYSHLYQYFTYFAKAPSNIVIKEDIIIIEKAPKAKKTASAKKKTPAKKAAPVKKAPAKKPAAKKK